MSKYNYPQVDARPTMEVIRNAVNDLAAECLLKIEEPHKENRALAKLVSELQAEIRRTDVYVSERDSARRTVTQLREQVAFQERQLTEIRQQEQEMAAVEMDRLRKMVSELQAETRRAEIEKAYLESANGRIKSRNDAMWKIERRAQEAEEQNVQLQAEVDRLTEELDESIAREGCDGDCHDDCVAVGDYEEIERERGELVDQLDRVKNWREELYWDSKKTPRNWKDSAKAFNDIVDLIAKLDDLLRTTR